ncbi:MAG: ABC transporter substrate-binding protein [Planctomycetes bacterium]|nr:ABC transporter substrate-binding protein [Planctomycetota bacterium]
MTIPRSFTMKIAVAVMMCAAMGGTKASVADAAETAGSANAVRIGVCLSLSGEFSASGKKALAGMRLRMQMHNEAPGTVGPVELVIRDDGSKADQAKQVVSELIHDEKVQLILGPISTNLILGLRDMARENEVVLISPSVTSPLVGRDGDWAFRLLFDDEFQGVALARYLYRELGVRRVASIVNERLSYAKSVNSAFRRVFEEEGGEITTEQMYVWVASEEQEHDFTDVLHAAADSQPDMILLPNNSVDISTITRQSLGIVDPAVDFCGGDTWLHENILYSGGNNVEGSIFVSGIDYDADSMQQFMYLFDQSNDPDAQPSSVLGYDTMSLALEGLKNGTTGREIRDGLYKVRDLKLATGGITIDPVRGSEKTAYIHRIIEQNGEFVSTIIDEVRP